MTIKARDMMFKNEGKLQATRDLNITAGQWLANHNEILSGGIQDYRGGIVDKKFNEILSGNATLNAGTYAHNFETAKIQSGGAMTIKARDMMFKNGEAAGHKRP